MHATIDQIGIGRYRRARRLNISQAADELGVCRATMSKLIRSGAITAHQVSPRRVVIAAEEIERYRERCRVVD